MWYYIINSNIRYWCIVLYYNGIQVIPGTVIIIIGASMSEPHIDELNIKKSVCMYICIYVCLFQSLTQISLTLIVTLYYNGFSGRVQNLSCHLITHALACCALARDHETRQLRVK